MPYNPFSLNDTARFAIYFQRFSTLFIGFFFSTLLLSTVFNSVQAAEPFWGDTKSQSADTPAEQLKRGQWVWTPQLAESGPMLVLVDLNSQLLYVYRNSVLIGYSSVSSGKKGFETPTGVFHTLQKDRHHFSTLYHKAPMPYTQRLTWDGVALHAGGVPNYPSSHGCVHLPSAFAEALFETSPMGMTVVVSHVIPTQGLSSHLTSPLQANSGESRTDTPLSSGQDYRWTPELQNEGPLSLVVSLADQRLLVLRAGTEIGRAKLNSSTLPAVGGTLAFVAQTEQGQLEWKGLALPQHPEQQLSSEVHQAAALLPADFLALLKPILTEGTSLVITDSAILPASSGGQLTLLTNQAPQS